MTPGSDSWLWLTELWIPLTGVVTTAAIAILALVATIRIGNSSQRQWEREQRAAFADMAHRFLRERGLTMSAQELMRQEILAGGDTSVSVWVVGKLRDIAAVFPGLFPQPVPNGLISAEENTARAIQAAAMMSVSKWVPAGVHPAKNELFVALLPPSRWGPNP